MARGRVNVFKIFIHDGENFMLILLRDLYLMRSTNNWTNKGSLLWTESFGFVGLQKT